MNLFDKAENIKRRTNKLINRYNDNTARVAELEAQIADSKEQFHSGAWVVLRKVGNAFTDVRELKIRQDRMSKLSRWINRSTARYNRLKENQVVKVTP